MPLIQFLASPIFRIFPLLVVAEEGEAEEEEEEEEAGAEGTIMNISNAAAGRGAGDLD